MRCILMNKNMPVVELELDDDTATILKVMKIFRIGFPACRNRGKNRYSG